MRRRKAYLVGDNCSKVSVLQWIVVIFAFRQIRDLPAGDLQSLMKCIFHETIPSRFVVGRCLIIPSSVALTGLPAPGDNQHLCLPPSHCGIWQCINTAFLVIPFDTVWHSFWGQPVFSQKSAPYARTPALVYFCLPTAATAPLAASAYTLCPWVGKVWQASCCNGSIVTRKGILLLTDQ